MILFAVYSVAGADSGKLAPSDGVITYDSNEIIEYRYLPAVQLVHSEAGDLQRIIKTGLSGAPLPSSSLWEKINSNSSSLPESSTMLILGLGLIGLAGYGGRKKFKH